MDVSLANKIKKQLQRELVRRQMISYFTAKGYDNFERPLYPPTCWDLSVKVQDLFNKTEIVPFSEDADVNTGVVKVGWNLFVLGTNRLALGYTTHTNSVDIQRCALGEAKNDLPIEFQTTPHEVIDFILDVLDSSKTGYTPLPPDYQIPMGAAELPIAKGPTPRVGPTASGQFYAR